MMHVLLPTDFSENSFQAALFTAGIVGVEGVKYTLVHTWYDPDPSVGTWARMGTGVHQAGVEGMRQWEERIRGAAAFAGAEVVGEVIHGPLTGVLDALAEERKADLIAMGTLGQTGAGLWGSNASATVRNSRFPVLVVPAHAGTSTVRRILFADDRKGVSTAQMDVALAIARRTKADVVLGHMRRDDWEELEPAIKQEYEVLLGGIPHRYTSVLGKDIAVSVGEMAAREKADLIAVLHRNVGFFEGLFRSSTSKSLVLNSDIPLLVLQEG